MSEQGSKKVKPLSRRDFLRLLGVGGTALAFAPFVPWGNFMPNPSSVALEKAQVILPDGTQANMNTFQVNHAEVITYPKTGDRVLDEEAFRKWQFIRLPEEFGGISETIVPSLGDFIEIVGCDLSTLNENDFVELKPFTSIANIFS